MKCLDHTNSDCGENIMMKANDRRTTGLTLAAAGCLLILTACGGGDAGPTEPTIPNIQGSYGGTWNLTLTNQNTGESASLSCPGSVTISSQSDDSFSGSYLIDAGGDCDTSDSGNVAGTVRTDGGVNLGLGSASGSTADFEDITGCTYTGGDNQLTGSVSGGSMSIDAEFFSDCPDGAGGTVPIRWVFAFNGS